eukprot:504319-Amphidinium_carterae.1
MILYEDGQHFMRSSSAATTKVVDLNIRDSERQAPSTTIKSRECSTASASVDSRGTTRISDTTSMPCATKSFWYRTAGAGGARLQWFELRDLCLEREASDAVGSSTKSSDGVVPVWLQMSSRHEGQGCDSQAYTTLVSAMGTSPSITEDLKPSQKRKETQSQ